MKSICLISTVYEGARAIESIWELHPKKVILLVDKGSKKEEIRTAISEIKKLSKIEGVSFDFEEHEISIKNIKDVTLKTIDLIDKNKAYEIILNLSESSKLHFIGVLFGAYARSDLISRIMYISKPVKLDLPILELSKFNGIKKEILSVLATEDRAYSINDLQAKTKLNKMTLYKYVKELIDAKYLISDGDIFKITEKGQWASL